MFLARLVWLMGLADVLRKCAFHIRFVCGERITAHRAAPKSDSGRDEMGSKFRHGPSLLLARIAKVPKREFMRRGVNLLQKNVNRFIQAFVN
jgi:hypothetical protein